MPRAGAMKPLELPVPWRPLRDDQVRRITLAVAAASLLAWWLIGLDAAALFDVDEGAFGEASRHMSAGEDWGHTWLNGADRFDKPILVYWLQAAAVRVLGPVEAAVRLPSALCGWLWCLALGSSVLRSHGLHAGVVTACIAATTLGPALIGRAATADALLQLLLTLTLLDLAAYLRDRPRHPGARRRLCRVGLWIGLGLLAKGPVALILPAGALLLAPWLSPRPLGPWIRRAVVAPTLWLPMLAVAAPWYLYALHRHGYAFVQGFLLHHNVERFVAPMEGHSAFWLLPWLALPLLLMPWTPLALRLWPLRRQLLQSTDDVLCIAWVLFTLGFFSLAQTKLPHYALYAAAPALLIIARPRDAQTCGPRLGAGLLAASGVCVFIGILGTAAALHAQWNGRLPPFESALVQRMLEAPGPADGQAVPVLLLLVGLGALQMRLARWRQALVCTGAFVACHWTIAVVVPWWAEAAQSPVRILARHARDQGLPVVQWGLHQPSAGFYRESPAPRRAPEPGEVALVRVDRLERLIAERPGLPAPVVLKTEGPYALAWQAPPPR